MILEKIRDDMPAAALSPKRVLVVEDSYLLAEVLCTYLTEHDFVPVGPVGMIEAAFEMAREASFDAAIVDINLSGTYSFPLCEILADRGIPYLFLTGVDELAVIPPDLREVPLLYKPFKESEMSAALNTMLQRAGQPPSSAA
jgi:DNA-binding response OmpR family regulator